MQLICSTEVSPLVNTNSSTVMHLPILARVENSAVTVIRLLYPNHSLTDITSFSSLCNRRNQLVLHSHPPSTCFTHRTNHHHCSQLHLVKLSAQFVDTPHTHYVITELVQKMYRAQNRAKLRVSRDPAIAHQLIPEQHLTA